MSMYISWIKQKEKEEREKLEGRKREYKFLTKFWYKYLCCVIQEREEQKKDWDAQGDPKETCHRED